jgi:hypothetical protein
LRNGRNGIDGGKDGREDGRKVNDRGKKGTGRRDARQGRKEIQNEGTYKMQDRMKVRTWKENKEKAAGNIDIHR